MKQNTKKAFKGAVLLFVLTMAALFSHKINYKNLL